MGIRLIVLHFIYISKEAKTYSKEDKTYSKEKKTYSLVDP